MGFWTPHVPALRFPLGTDRIDNVRCNMHQTRLQVKRTSRLRLKRKLKSV